MEASDRLTDRQLSVLRAIHELAGERGLPPTMRAVAGRVGWSVEVVWSEIHVLRARGRLAPAEPGAPRSLRLTDQGLREIGVEPTVEVPRSLLCRAYHALEIEPMGGSWHRDDEFARKRAQRELREVLRMVYRCESCGEWLAEEDLDGDGHVVTATDREGYPVPELCGPVRLVGEEAV